MDAVSASLRKVDRFISVEFMGEKFDSEKDTEYRPLSWDEGAAPSAAEKPDQADFVTVRFRDRASGDVRTMRVPRHTTMEEIVMR